MRLALIGGGQVVERYHLPALSALREIQVSCIVEPNDDRRRQIADRLPGILSCAQLDEALAAGAADAALIATPPATHAGLTRRCLAAGWHVLVEKPMAMSRTEAAAILAEAERAERCVAVGFNRRFRPSWSRARHMLVTSVPDLLDEATFTLGFDTRRWRYAASLDDEATALAGLLEDVVPHQADLLAFLFERPIDRLCADEVRFHRGQSVALTYTAQLRGGSTIRCQALHLPGHMELLEMRLNGQALAVTPEAVIVGDLMPVLRRRCRDIWCRGVGAGRRLLGRPSATVASFIRQHCAFHLAVQGRPAVDLADGAAGAATCAVGDALCASARAGGAAWVDVEEPMP